MAFVGSRMFNHDATASSGPAFRSRQLCRIESQFFAGAAHEARVKDLVRLTKRNFRLSAFSMHCDHNRTLMPLIMLAVIDAAALLNEPFSKCSAFHIFAPVDCRISYHSRDVVLIFNFLAVLRTVRLSSPPQPLNFIPWRPILGAMLRALATALLDLNQGRECLCG